MRHVSLPLLGIASALALPFTAQAAFEGDFYIVDGATPAGVYTFDSGVATLGAWNAGFFLTSSGETFIDTTGAPGCVTLGSSNGYVNDYEVSTTTLFIDMPEDGVVSFTVDAFNTGSGGYGAFEVYLSGEAVYFLTNAEEHHELVLNVSSGDTLEFRSESISNGLAAYATNTSTISNFVFTSASAIPEPAAFASLLGICVLGFAGRRRRAAF